MPGSNTYTINYNEILRWISNSPTNPFPTQLHGGPHQVLQLDSDRDHRDLAQLRQHGPAVLGRVHRSRARFQANRFGRIHGHQCHRPATAAISPGEPPAQSSPPSTTQYMSYTDNPLRPNLRYWFSPILMVDYLQNYNMANNISNYFFMQPGDSYEAPIYTAKQAYVAAVNTMQYNHPNDWFTVVPYSWPRTSATATGRLNCVRCPLGTNYNYATAALLFPFSTINADGSANNTEITPYAADPATAAIPSSDFADTPRADGDTSFAMALMLCYNQFAVTSPTDTTLRSYATSSPITFPSGMAGGMGRKGAQKVVIFETDGLPNCSATASLVNAGSYSYYKIRYNMNNPSSSEYPSINATTINNSAVLSQIYTLVQNLASTYGTTRNPFRLYAVGFGPVFQGTNASGGRNNLADHAILRRHAEQSDHGVAVESNHHGYGLADVNEHDHDVHRDLGKWRANRPYQVTMPNPDRRVRRCLARRTGHGCVRAERSRPCVG